MISYKDSGVNNEEGYKTINLIKEEVEKTHNKYVLNSLGGFGALYELKNYKNPVLVSGTDGVGTKLKIAFELKRYDSVGQDLVAMCVNDILCHGARPLFFLDYLACAKLNANEARALIFGISKACKENNLALIGGETAQMPGFYQEGDYDMAGFCVGVVEKDKIINGSKIKNGDSIIALKSSGIHSNGFSLVRKIFKDYNEKFNGKNLGEILLEPTKIYSNSLLKILENFNIKGMAHITGGGLIENIPRIIPDNLQALIFKDKIQILEIFKLIQNRGEISEDEMFNTFNMGVGFVLICEQKDKDSLINEFKILKEEAYEIGKIQVGDKKICLK